METAKMLTEDGREARQPPASALSQAWHRLEERLGLDRAISFGMLSQGWSMVAGPVSVGLVASCLSPEVMGYYYSFGSILSMQSFLELGVDSVITQFASHEWAHLQFKDGRITGDPAALSRLTSLARFMATWYALAALAPIAVIAPFGYWFFETSRPSPVHWLGPWLALCAAFGGQILIQATFNLLNGCGQIHKIYTWGFFQNVVTTVAFWLMLAGNAQLWTSAGRTAACVLCSSAFLSWRYRAFLKLFVAPAGGHEISWRTEILPFQTKVALTGFAGYLAFQVFTPVLFRTAGPVVAGQMGMTWQLMITVLSIGAMWINTKAPKFGALIAKRDYKELDRLVFRSGAFSVALTCAGYAAFFAFVCGLNAIHHRWAARLLPPRAAGLFCLAMALLQSSSVFSVYLRAHKKEPLVVVSIVYGFLVAASTWVLSSRYGATGVAAGFLALNMISTPWVISIWYRCRKRWHDPSADPSRWAEIYV